VGQQYIPPQQAPAAPQQQQWQAPAPTGQPAAPAPAPAPAGGVDPALTARLAAAGVTLPPGATQEQAASIAAQMGL
jgi:hypothetical protein